MELVDFDPEGELKVVAAMLYPYTDLARTAVLERVGTMSVDDRIGVMRAYVGERTNRRNRPGRALERTDYRFDVLSDYGAFRDLQRHRLATIEWQSLGPNHGYERPASIDEAGATDRFDEAMWISRTLGEPWRSSSRTEPPTPWHSRTESATSMQFNAREAMHLLELRSSVQGHPELPGGRAANAPTHRASRRVTVPSPR